MPQIIPGATTTSAPPQPTQSPPTPQQGWGNDNQWGWNPSSPMNQSQGGEKRLTPQERVEMIEKVYKEILDRKPDTRDINYYKYSTLSEEEIKTQLITGKEHKQLMQEGREYKKLKERAMNSETRVTMLESQIKDQIEEFKQLSTLLTEKNKYIQQLRDGLNNPYNLVDHSAEVSKSVESKSQVFSSPVVPKTPESRSKTFKAFIRDILKNLLSD
jgi:uncharacterized coiled-coil protein SlyX